MWNLGFNMHIPTYMCMYMTRKEGGIAGKEGTREGKEGKGKTIFCLMPHIHTNIHIHACTHTLMRAQMYTYTHVCTFTHIHTHMCTLTHAHTCTRTHACPPHTQRHTMKAEELLERKREKGGETGGLARAWRWARYGNRHIQNVPTKPITLYTKKLTWTWWHMPPISAFRRQRQMSPRLAQSTERVPGQSRIHSKRNLSQKKKVIKVL